MSADNTTTKARSATSGSVSAPPPFDGSASASAPTPAAASASTDTPTDTPAPAPAPPPFDALALIDEQIHLVVRMNAHLSHVRNGADNYGQIHANARLLMDLVQMRVTLVEMRQRALAQAQWMAQMRQSSPQQAPIADDLLRAMQQRPPGPAPWGL